MEGFPRKAGFNLTAICAFKTSVKVYHSKPRKHSHLASQNAYNCAKYFTPCIPPNLIVPSPYLPQFTGFLYKGAILLSVLFSGTLIAASDYELGVQSYQNKEFKQARKHWELGAKNANLSAIFNLGILLSKGIGGAADPERAVNLFRRAGDAGLAMGQHNLALAYYTGNGVQKDNERARIWWERAARQNHTQAQFNLAVLLWNGDGVRKQADEGVKWFRRASDNGHSQAHDFLESIFEESKFDIDSDLVDNADQISNPSLSSMLAFASEAFDQKNYAKAHTLWLSAADAGSAGAELQLARLYEQGLGVERNDQRAFEFVQRSAKNGQPQAQYQLGLHYLDGILIDRNETLALYWIQSAADKQHIKARDYLEQLR